MKNKIIVVGGGGYAKVIISTLKNLGEYDILGYTDLINKGSILGINYLGNDDVLSDIIIEHKNCNAVIGFANFTISDKRNKIFNHLKDIGFDLPVIISKNAIVNDGVLIGEGTVVLKGVIINVGSEIGKGVIINTSAVIEHDCKVGDFVHFSTGAIIGGGVVIGHNSIIGSGAKVIQYKKITENCLIEIGSIVIDDLLAEGIYFGVPAKKII